MGTIRRRALVRGRPFLYTLVAVIVAAAVLVPVYLVFVTALKDAPAVAQDPLGLPPQWAWTNLGDAWTDGNFGRYLRNSVIVVFPTVVTTVLFSLLAGYGFAAMPFRLKRPLFLVLIAGMMVPLGVLAIPLYYLTLNLGLLDTQLALILPLIGISMPFGTLLLRGFIQDLPRDILDAARIDGCSDLRLLYHVVAPLARPAVLSLVVFIFTWTWNEFLLTSVLLQTENARTLPLGLNFFRGRYSSNYPLLMSGALITFLPVMAVYVLFQRHFTRGIAAGALGGK